MNKSVKWAETLENLEQKATRDGFGEGLLAAGRENKNIIALCADVTESVRMEAFAQELPAQYFEMGVSEQNMMGVAAGLALSGKIPFMATYAVFNPGRNWDQLRVSVAYSQANVKVIGAHAGISVGPDGATHQALEDVAITRVLPGLMVVVPTDAEEARKSVAAISAFEGPVYMRLGRDKVSTLTLLNTPFKLGVANLLIEGGDVTICANGALVYEALLAAEQLKKAAIFCEVLAVHTVKPLDKEAILQSVRKTGACVTAEEAQIIGGLGSAVAELVSEHCPTPLRRVGVHDRFGESGTADELMDAYGLRAHNIIEAVHAALKMKSNK